MPLYTYICPECDEVFDVIKHMTDPDPPGHNCGYKGVLARKYDVPGITFRGSGFYHTDKALYDIDPEYDLTPAEQDKYWEEKYRDAGIERGGGSGW